MSDVAALAAATPASRDRYADFLRVAALLGVMLGHFLLTAITYERTPTGDEFDLTSLVARFEWARYGTWLLQVMPVFFVVGGFAHAVAWRSLRARGGGYADFVRARVWRLVLPALVFVLAGTAVGVAVELLAAPVGDTLAFSLQIAGQLLWFIGIYLIAAAFAPLTLRLHERLGWRGLALLMGAVAAVDILRLSATADAVKWLNFGFVWLAVHQLGYFYADLRHRLTARHGWMLAAVGLAVAVGLIALGPYGVSLVSYVGEPLSNLAPPTAVLLAFAVAQAGLLLAARGLVTRWLDRPGPWKAVIVAGAVAMTAFLWHFVALMLMYGLLYRLGAPFPEPATASWWWWRLPLLALFAVLVALAVLAFRRFDRPAVGATLVGPSAVRSAVAVLAAACAIAGMISYAVVGFRGVLSGFTARAAMVDVTSLAALALVLMSAALAWTATRPGRPAG